MSLEQPRIESRSANLAVRRTIVARLHLRHQKVPAIHKALLQDGLKCDIGTIYRDVAALEATWLKELVSDPVAVKAKELAEYEEAAEECWLQYSNTGDSRWLTELRGWKKSIADLLGLNAPIKVDARVLNFTIEFDTPNANHSLNGTTPPSENGHQEFPE